MGDDAKAPSASESTASMMKAFTTYLPQLIQTQGQAILPSELYKVNAADVVSPLYAQMMEKLYSQYGPSLHQIGSDLDAQDKWNSTSADADILAGPGARLAGNAQAIDMALNPEFYKTRELNSNKINELLKSINVDGPNPEAERLVNSENIRSGNFGNPSSTVGVSNALRFGDERMKRQQLLSAATQGATNFLQPSKASFDPFGRQVSTNGESKFTGITPVGGDATNTGTNLMNATTQFATQANQINSQRRDTLDRFNETMSSMPSD